MKNVSGFAALLKNISIKQSVYSRCNIDLLTCLNSKKVGYKSKSIRPGSESQQKILNRFGPFINHNLRLL